jgi:hypothetical protein
VFVSNNFLFSREIAMTMKLRGIICAVAIALPASVAFAVEKPTPKAVTCTPIKTAAQLQAIKNKLDGTFCLMNHIDAGSIANFIPIGDQNTQFTGQFYGNGHVIRNLKINNTTSIYVGLFGIVIGGIIQDVGLINAKVSGSFNNASVGGLIGVAVGTDRPVIITRVHTAGGTKCTGTGCVAGGIIGVIGSNVSVTEAWSSAGVTSTTAAGGAFGYLANGPSTIDRTFATGRVTCITCLAAGGLAAVVNDKVFVTRSFATGPVTGATTNVGGLVGLSSTGSSFQQTYATGPVMGGASANVGSLIGKQTDGVVKESYGAGAVVGGAGAVVGGLIGVTSGAPTTINSYWDTLTTGQGASAGGAGVVGLTTAQLRNALPTGFGGAWGISKNLSYPYLTKPDLFTSPLATLVLSDAVFSFSPIQQTDKSQYQGNPAHANAASLATVYTMIARAVGNTDNVALLQDVKIDKYFWKDATQTTRFAGPLTDHATLGPMKPIAAGAPLNASNVVGQLNIRRLVILRGTYAKAGGGTGTHHMLATLYTKNTSNAVSTVVANDPFTGTQIEINPTTKRVTTPFPLKNFTVNGYQAVTGLH